MEITANMLALATTGVAALTVLVTFWNGRKAAMTQLRVAQLTTGTQLRLAREERSWKARAEVYVDVLWWTEWWRLRFASPEADQQSMADWPEYRDHGRAPDWQELVRARVNAFGTLEARRAFGSCVAAFVDAEAAYDMIYSRSVTKQSADANKKARDGLPALVTDAVTRSRALDDILREELQRHETDPD
ncbi:hypothetical protein [Actinophytocola sediminis]